MFKCKLFKASLHYIQIDKLLEELNAIIDWRESTKSSYFWTPYIHASMRRHWKKCNNKELEFDYEGDHYYIEQYAKMSCQNVYTGLSVYKNDEQKDLRTIKKLVRKMEKKFVNSVA